MVVLKKTTSIFFIYNHMKVCSVLLSKQQLFRAIKNRHVSTIRLAVWIPNVRGNNFNGNSWIL